MSKLVKKSKYYYLQKGFRENGKTKLVEKYLGVNIPSNIAILKEDFEHYIRKNRFEESLLKIKYNFKKEFESFPKTAKFRYFENFSIAFTYNSQAIEGSKLTLIETRVLIKDGLTPRKYLKDSELAIDHHRLFIEMLEYKNALNLQTILYFHKKLFERSYPDIAGKIREHNVRVVGSKVIFPNFTELEFILRDFFKWYEKNKQIYNPVELAALVHLKFVTIHPFSDGNGRMSRFLMNLVLYKNGYPMLDIEYDKRVQYYNSLEKSQIGEKEDYFVDYIIKKYLKEYKNYL